jgi:hypothetical protein
MRCFLGSVFMLPRIAIKSLACFACLWAFSATALIFVITSCRLAVRTGRRHDRIAAWAQAPARPWTSWASSNFRWRSECAASSAASPGLTVLISVQNLFHTVGTTLRHRDPHARASRMPTSAAQPSTAHASSAHEHSTAAHHTTSAHRTQRGGLTVLRLSFVSPHISALRAPLSPDSAHTDRRRDRMLHTLPGDR